MLLRSGPRSVGSAVLRTAPLQSSRLRLAAVALSRPARAALLRPASNERTRCGAALLRSRGVLAISKRSLSNIPSEAPLGSAAALPSEPVSVLVVQPYDHAGSSSRSPEMQLDEAKGLAASVAGWTVKDALIMRRPRKASSHIFGSGQAEHIAEVVDALRLRELDSRDAPRKQGRVGQRRHDRQRGRSEPAPGEATADKAVDVAALRAQAAHIPAAVFINSLHVPPKQKSALEEQWGAKVYDRFSVILGIFESRARSREARLSVQLARVSYDRSQLVQSEANYDQQAGAVMSISGSGESQLEKDRRILADKATKLQRQLEQVQARREQTAGAREDRQFPIVSIVGYTNAGKTQLHGLLTRSGKRGEDRLFASLDTTARLVRLPSGLQAVFVDTVGLIADLPHELVHAFRATLSDAVECDVLLHLRDAAHPETEQQALGVRHALADLALSPRLLESHIEVWNKSDLLAPAELEKRLASATSTALAPLLLKPGKPSSALSPAAAASGPSPSIVAVSALTSAGVPRLLALIDERLQAARGVASFAVTLPASNGAAVAALYRHAVVTDTQPSADGQQLTLTVRCVPAFVQQLQRNHPPVISVQSAADAAAAARC